MKREPSSFERRLTLRLRVTKGRGYCEWQSFLEISCNRLKYDDRYFNIQTLTVFDC